MDKYKENDVVAGIVTGIEKYGIFVSIDKNYSGLIHISEISENFVREINDYVSLDEKINVKIMEIDQEKKLMKLSIKNIDYRMNKKKKSSIIETKHGFSTLKKMLPVWINAKEKEIIAKNR